MVLGITFFELSGRHQNCTITSRDLHDESEDAETPHVGGEADGLHVEHLGRAVLQRIESDAHRQLGVHAVRQAEVDELQLPALPRHEYHVLRLQ